MAEKPNLGMLTDRLIPDGLKTVKDPEKAQQLAQRALVQMVEGMGPAKHEKHRQAQIAEAQSRINSMGGINYINTPAGRISRLLDNLSDGPLGRYLNGR